MKKIFFIIVLFINSILFGQKLKKMKPIQFNKVDTNFSDEFVAKYNSKESLLACEKIYAVKKYHDFTKEDLEILNIAMNLKVILGQKNLKVVVGIVAVI